MSFPAFTIPLPLLPPPPRLVPARKPRPPIARVASRELPAAPPPPQPASKTNPPSPADWLRANEAALRRSDTSALAATGRVPARPAPPPLLSVGLLNIAGGAHWLHSSPPSYCSVDTDLDAVVRSLEKKVFYLGPVTRNKVVRAVQLGRAAAAEECALAEVFRENITVGLIVADLQMDCDTVCAAVLNGLVGTAACTTAQVEREVGPDVLRVLRFHAQVVDTVQLCEEDSFTEMSFSNLRELILVGAMDEHRAISLELARAVLRIRTLDALTDEKKKIAVARQTMYLYAPLANQLGIWYVQGELEELAFMYLQPERFEEIRHLVGERRRECESTLVKSKEFLERVLSTTPEVRNLVRTVLIKGRVKGLYSVYRKMRRSGKKLYEIYDLLALRVVVQPKRADDEAEKMACYAVADVIEQHYETFESRAKDYIAHPKRNGYRSLHLTVVPRGGSTPLEIQIRTEKMHHVAEFGAAAHWIYKERNSEELAETESEEESTIDVEEVDVQQEADEMYNNEVEVREEGLSTEASCRKMRKLEELRTGLVSKRRVTGEEVQEHLRQGYVSCLASAIRTSRVIVAAAGQLYGLAVGSTLLDLAHGLGVASLGGIALVNGTVAPLTQRLEMNDIVRFISYLPEA